MASATLRLTRRWGGVVYGRRPFQISVDGAVVGSISSRQSIDLPVEPGHHTLRLGSGRHLSPERAFDVEEGEVVTYWCRGAGLWPMYLAALVKPDLWIRLKAE